MNGALVNEDIIATILGSDEAETLLGVEPFALTKFARDRHVVV